MFYKFENTCISWKLIYSSDIISISGFTLNFLKLSDSNQHVSLLKINFDTPELAQSALADLYNNILKNHDPNILQDLSTKVDEMYYMPNMPGFFHSKNSFDNIIR